MGFRLMLLWQRCWKLTNEAEIMRLRQMVNGQEDMALWKAGETNYSKNFNIRRTWKLIRTQRTKKVLSRGVWFKCATTKYALFTWLVFQNRLITGDKMRIWNVGARTDCVLCENHEKDRNHLFLISILFVYLDGISVKTLGR